MPQDLVILVVLVVLILLTIITMGVFLRLTRPTEHESLRRRSVKEQALLAGGFLLSAAAIINEAIRHRSGK